MTAYLVGAGPGDPGLLTIRAAELLGVADVVIHDRLVDPRVIELAKPGALIIDVGKMPGSSAMSQAAVNTILVQQAQTASTVVRLKGGDPYVLGRGGEEALALEEAGIDYEVVAGVSSVIAVASAAGVPLTMRGMSSSFAVVSGHEPDAIDGPGAVPWQDLGRSGVTLVILMGAAHRVEIASRLIASGRNADTPVIVVENGTTIRQRSLRTTLGGLGAAMVRNPATIVVGDVAQLSLASYEDRPLFSWRVVVTRAKTQASSVVAELNTAGATVIEIPTIAIVPPDDGGTGLRASVALLSTFDWVIFSSENAVDAFFECIHDARELAGTRVAAIGNVTARALRAHGIVADLVPDQFHGDALLDAFPDPGSTSGRRVLIPRALRGREVLVDGLRTRGWEVEVVACYQTVHPVPSSELAEAVNKADAVIFTSSSTVDGFIEHLGHDAMPPVIASIGPITSATISAHGFSVSVEPEEHSTTALVEALIGFARDRGRRDIQSN